MDIKRIKGGVLADGINSALAAVLNSFPNSTFSQNNGIILLTGVASRYVGYFIAGMLVLLGLRERFSKTMSPSTTPASAKFERLPKV